jgi:molybdopterin biosynthesis enzyme MoaB
MGKSFNPSNEHTNDTAPVAVSEVAPEVTYPKKVILVNRHTLVLKMPGQDAAVTKSFREGQVVNNPETIKNLVDSNAPIEALG